MVAQHVNVLNVNKLYTLEMLSVIYHNFLNFFFFVLCLVAQLQPCLCNPMDCSLLGSSVCGTPQARILEWVAVPSSRGSSQLRD